MSVTKGSEEMKRIYGASRTSHAEKWKAWRSAGLPIVSSWIDEAGPGQTKDEILLYLLTGWEGLLNAEIAEKMAEDLARLAAYREESK